MTVPCYGHLCCAGNVRAHALSVADSELPGELSVITFGISGTLSFTNLGINGNISVAASSLAEAENSEIIQLSKFFQLYFASVGLSWELFSPLWKSFSLASRKPVNVY